MRQVFQPFLVARAGMFGAAAQASPQSPGEASRASPGNSTGYEYVKLYNFIQYSRYLRQQIQRRCDAELVARQVF